MEKNDIIRVKTKVEGLGITVSAINGWLETNEPVKAYKAMLKLDEKINEIVEGLELFEKGEK